MSSFHIRGGQRLEGSVQTSGSKNAVLPLLAASLLFDAEVRLTNVPAIRDVGVMKQILAALGKQVIDDSSDALTLQPNRSLQSTVPSQLAEQLRASILFLGPLLARLGNVTLPQPGGDLIGRRPIHTHLLALEQLGARVEAINHGYHLIGHLTGTDIYLDESSVTGTENVIMAAALATGQTIIRNAAKEQHVVALCTLLLHAGLAIDGIGTDTLVIDGRGGQPLTQPVTFAVPYDELDAGTFAIAAVLTRGNVQIHDYPSLALRPLTEKLRSIGATVAEEQPTVTRVKVDGSRPLASFALQVRPAPGFPTDLQPPMAVLATQVSGTSHIHDWMYERRFGYIEHLISFGASIDVHDPHRISIIGPRQLTGRHIFSPDIRAGIAFVLAALVADGESVIDHADIIDRGYANLDTRLARLGAAITRRNE